MTLAGFYVILIFVGAGLYVWAEIFAPIRGEPHHSAYAQGRVRANPASADQLF